MTRGIKAVSRRAKGKRFEKDVAEDLAAFFGVPASDALHARSGKKESDVHLTSTLRRVWPFWTEVKNHVTLKIPAWLKQAESDAKLDGTGLEPIVVFRQHRQSRAKKYVVVDYAFFRDLVWFWVNKE